MNNNVNSNGNIVTQPVNVQPTSSTPVNTQTVVSGVTPTQVVYQQPVNNVNAIPVAAGVNGIPTNLVSSNNVNSLQQKKNGDVSTNTYLLVGFFVGFVLLAAGFLLFLLLSGTIGSRNRLTFSKTINDVGYTHLAMRYYKFDGNVYTQVNNVDTFTFTSLTDEEYNTRFEKFINDETNGISEYGFGTQISRNGNVVTITSYNPNFFGDTKDDVKEDNLKEGFTLVK